MPKIPDHGVFPIRPLPVPAPALAASGETTDQPRRRSKPVEDRPYRILVVPPTPGARTRAFNVARWQAAGVASLIALAVFVAGASVSTIVASLRGPDAFAPADELTYLRDQLVAVEDSLSVTRAELADARNARDSAAILAAVAERPRPLVTRARGIGARSSASLPPNAEGLPVIGRIASRFSYARRHPLLKIVRPHLGVDVSAPRGTRITAPAAGRVSFVGRKFAFGLVVEIEHANGVLTRYAHLRTAVVKVGDRVTPGASIATVGSSGLTSGPHLHYEILNNGRAVDPLRFKLPQAVGAVAAPVASPPAPVVQDTAIVAPPETLPE